MSLRRALFPLALFLSAASAQDGVIEGKVRDSISHAPLAGVSVEALDTKPPRSMITAGDGAFRFDHLTPGAYRIKYTLPGYRGSLQVANLKPDANPEPLILELTPFARIEGSILDEEGLPLPGVMVYTGAIGSNLRATADKEGHYSVDELEPGSYRIDLRTPYELRRKTLKRDPETGEIFGYANIEFYPGTADVRAAVPVALSAGLQLRAFDIRLRRTRLVEFTGRLVERAGGQPLTDGRVELYPGGGPVNDETFNERKPDADGGFRFDLVQPGPYTLLVYRSAGVNALPYTVPVELGKTGIQDLKIAVPPFATISGSVRVPSDIVWSGELRATLRSTTILSASRDFRVSAERFTIEEVPAGLWTLHVESTAGKRPDLLRPLIKSATFGGLDILTAPFAITESGNPPLEIQLTAESGRISGTVVGPDGIQPQRTMILVGKENPKDPMSMRAGGITKEDGSFMTDTLPPGIYRIMAAGGGRSFKDAIQVEVKPGETTQVRLTLPKP